MSDPTNDIDGLRGFLSLSARHSFNTIPSDVADIYHRALTALVAERDELRDVLYTQIEGRDALVAERDALKQRVAELEVARVLTLSRAFQSEEALRHDRDRDLRERLVCAALTGILANYESRNHGADDVAEWAVVQADATLSAMRKGDTNAK